jgi:hypothetical protein
VNPADLATMRDRFDEVAAQAVTTRKAAVLVVQQFPVPADSGVGFPPVRESIANLMAFVELGTAADLAMVLDHSAAFDWVAVDCDHKLQESAAIIDLARERVPAARLLFYSDNQVWFDSALDMVQRLENGLSGKTVVLCGDGALAGRFAFTLPQLGVAVVAPSDSAAANASIVLGASQKAVSVDRALVERLPAQAAVYDLGIGNLSSAAADEARARGFRLFRLDNRAGISSAMVRLLETDHMVGTLMGRVTLRGVDVVAGGLLAPAGAVIVDNIRCPTIVFGVADGQGRFKPEPLDEIDRGRVAYVRGLIAHALEAGAPQR